MRLLFWTNAYWPMLGGSEVWAVRYVRELHARGHAILVVVAADRTGDVRRHRIDDVPVIELPLLSLMVPGAGRELAAMLRTLKQDMADFAPDVVQVNGVSVGALSLLRLARSSLPRPLLLTAHNVLPPDQMASGSPLDGIARAAGVCVGFDSHVSAWLSDRWPDAEVATIAHAVDGMAAPAFPPPKDGPILFCGRLNPEKGPLSLIDAFADLVRDRPDTRLVVVGDGPQRGAVEASIVAHGLAGHVTMIGTILPDRVAGWLDRCRMVVMPSLIEGFGLVAAEAAWRGRPVVASDVGGLRANIVHDETGLLVPPRDRQALTAAMRRILDEDMLAERLGAAARIAMERRPDWAAHVDAFERLLDRLCDTAANG